MRLDVKKPNVKAYLDILIHPKDIGTSFNYFRFFDSAHLCIYS